VGVLGRERELIAAYGRRLVADGLVVATHGNLSIGDGEAFAITPTAVPYGEIDADAVCVVDLDGNQLAGSLQPSTELPLHLAIYGERGPGAIVHAHAPFSTAIGCVLDELPATHHLVAEFGGAVRTAPYATPGTEGLAAVVLEALSDRSATLLQSHGTLTLGDSLEEAFSRTVLLESLAHIHWLSLMVGEPAALPDAEMARLVGLRCTYGTRESDVALLTGGRGRARLTRLGGRRQTSDRRTTGL
jgi:L-fuculose-phosphate aldolase